jgi:hypothetical protein
MGCFCGVYLSWIVNRAIQNHGHRVDLSIDPPCYDVDDLNLDVKTDVSLCLRMNDRLVDQSLDAMMDVSRGLRMNDLLDDLTMDVSHVNRNYVPRDLSLDAMTDGSHDHRRSDLLDGHSMDDDLMTDVSHVNRNYVRHDLKMDGNHVNRSCVRHDLNLVLMTDVNLYLRTNDLLDDQMTGVNLGVSLCHRMNVTDDLNDLNLDGNLDVNRGLHMSDLLGDLKTDGNHVNRNYAPRDLKMDASLDVMNHHVKLMVFPNTNCDRMSHDHLRYDRQMMRHHDTSRMDEMILDGKMKIHHVSWC